MTLSVFECYVFPSWRSRQGRRHGKSDRFVLGAYLALAGSVRFVIEFLRIDTRVLGPLSVAHIASFVALAIGLALVSTQRESE